MRILHQSVELRAQAFVELHLALQGQPNIAGSAPVVRAFAPVLFAKVDALTEQMIVSVDSGLDSAVAIYKQLQSACAGTLPGLAVLQINFVRQGAHGELAPPNG